MEIKKYRLQTEMENLKEGNEEWFKGTSNNQLSRTLF